MAQFVTGDECKPVKRVKKAGRGLKGYARVRSKRGQMAEIGRNGEMRKVRGYELEPAKLRVKLGEWHDTGVFPSPYTKSVLSDVIGALVSLGVNKAHALPVVMREMERLMSLPGRVRDGLTDWARFVGRPGKGQEGSQRGPHGRVMMNVLSLRRTNDRVSHYPVGLKMFQMGACVDIFRVGKGSIRKREDKGHFRIFLRLNTFSVRPLKEVYEEEGDIPSVDFSALTKGPLV